MNLFKKERDDIENLILQKIEGQMPTVPFWLYELKDRRHRREKNILKIWIVILSFIIIFMSIYFVEKWTQYDTLEYTQDGAGVNNINTGTQGNINESEDTNKKTQER